MSDDLLSETQKDSDEEEKQEVGEVFLRVRRGDVPIDELYLEIDKDGIVKRSKVVNENEVLIQKITSIGITDDCGNNDTPKTT